MTNFISSDKLKYHPKQVSEFLDTGFSSPISAQFQITNRCMFRCVYCDKTLNNNESTIDDKFINRLKELGIKSLVLTGGEPTIYSRFTQEIPRLAKEFKLGLVTTLYKYHKELESEFEWIKVSMDTIDEEKFQQIKKGKGVDKILENLETLYKNKQEKTTVGTQIVLTNENKNEYELVEFIERVYHFCDYIQIRPIESLDLYTYQEADYRVLKKIKEQYKKVVISEKFVLNQKPNSCPARWAQLLIDCDHNLLLCCNRVNDKIGSIYDTNIIELSKNYCIDFDKCYHSCVMAGNNHYLNNLINGKHKDFV